jgi:hypothetical protein
MAKENRDYPLSATPKIDFSIGGRGNDKKYVVGGSVNVPLYKGLSVGADKYVGNNGYNKYSGHSYNATLKIPLGKKNK